MVSIYYSETSSPNLNVMCDSVFQIQAAVDDVLESASSNGLKLNQEISEMQSLTVDTEEKWNVFIQTTESNYVEDSVAVEAGKCALEDGLQCW